MGELRQSAKSYKQRKGVSCLHVLVGVGCVLFPHAFAPLFARRLWFTYRNTFGWDGFPCKLLLLYLPTICCAPVIRSVLGRKRNKVIHNSNMYYFSIFAVGGGESFCDSLKILSLRPVGFREIGGL